MNRKINIQLNDLSGKSFKFEGLREFYEFLNTEATFWKEQRNLIENGQNQIHGALNNYNRLGQAAKEIESWTDKLKEWDDNYIQQQINSLDQNTLRHAMPNWLWSGHPFVKPFVDSHKEYGNAVATAFLDYITKKQIGNLNHHSAFLGAMIGYEFTNQDSEIIKRRNGEKASLAQLRSQLEKTTNTLIGETENLKEDLNSWFSENRETWSSWLKKSATEHSEQQTKHKDEFIAYMDGCRTRISDLENTYQEKLRLEKPAQYWKRAARKLGIQGGLWSLALIFSLLLGVVYFSGFFTEWLKGQQISVQLNTIQGVVIFGTVLAVYAFLVRTLSRLAFSSFHLMRDAEEREQLTYLYLSLINDQKIDENSRDIVLQALFSRSETGLLTTETAPTMPSVGEILRTASKP